MYTLTRFWEQVVRRHLHTHTFAQSTLNAQQDLIDLERLKIPNALHTIQVNLRLRGRYYPSGRPNGWKAGNYDYDHNTKRCTIRFNIDGLHLVTGLYCSQKIESARFCWDGGTFPMLDYQPGVLPLPIPVGLWDKATRGEFTFTPLVFNDDGHPLLPTFCVSGVVLDKRLAVEMRRKLAPTESLFTGLRLTRTGFIIE